MSRERKPGTVNPNKIPVYNHAGYLCGSCGPKATETVAARLSGERGHVLGKMRGRTAWVIPGRTIAQTSASAAGINPSLTGTNPAAVPPTPPAPPSKLFGAGTDGGYAASMRANKGSNK